MAKSDRVLRIFVLNLKVFEIIANPIIELEFALLHLLQQGDGGHSLECGSYQIYGARSGGGAGP